MHLRPVVAAMSGLALFVLPVEAAAPPVDLGLWQVQSATTLESAIPIQLPPAQAEELRRMGIPVPGQPTRRTDQSCLTERSFDRLGEPDHGRACHRENVQLTSGGLSAEVVCDGDGTKGRGHLDLVFDDPTHFHGTLNLKGRSKSAPGISGLNVSMSGRWLGAQCGSVKPLGG